MMSLKTQSNSEKASLVSLHETTYLFAFNFLLLWTVITDFNLHDNRVCVCVSQKVNAAKYDVRKLGGLWRRGVQSRIVSDVCELVNNCPRLCK